MYYIILSAGILALLFILRRISRMLAKCGTCRYQATLPCGIFCSACKDFDLWEPIDVEGDR